MTELTPNQQSAVSEAKLAVDCASSAIDHAILCGEALILVKAELGHGNYLPWIANEDRVPDQAQCRRYVTLAENQGMLNQSRGTDLDTLSIKGALKLINAETNKGKPAKKTKAPTTEPKEIIVEPDPIPAPVEEPLPAIELPLSDMVKLLPKDLRDAYTPAPGKLQSFVVAGVISNHKRIAKAIAGLSSSESRKVLQAVALLFEAQEPMFQKMFPGRKTKANQALELELKDKIAEAEQARLDYIAGNTVLPGFAFSKTEIRLIRGCLHSDRDPAPETKEKAFKVFQRIFAKLN